MSIFTGASTPFSDWDETRPTPATYRPAPVILTWSDTGVDLDDLDIEFAASGDRHLKEPFFIDDDGASVIRRSVVTIEL